MCPGAVGEGNNVFFVSHLHGVGFERCHEAVCHAVVVGAQFEAVAALEVECELIVFVGDFGVLHRHHGLYGAADAVAAHFFYRWLGAEIAVGGLEAYAYALHGDIAVAGDTIVYRVVDRYGDADVARGRFEGVVFGCCRNRQTGDEG